MHGLKEHWSFLKEISWKSVAGSTDDDWVDRMSHTWSAAILALFAGVVCTVQCVGEPIHCWCPAEFEDWHISYTNHYCWVSDTYYVAMSDVISDVPELRRNHMISYYQWVPLILLAQALLFKLPYILWHHAKSSSGINLGKLCAMVDSLEFEFKTDKAEKIRNVTTYLHRWLLKNRNYRSDAMTVLKQKTSNVFFCFGQQEGLFLSGLYLLIKMLYMANCAFQFWMLGYFLNLDFFQYGIETVNCNLGDCSSLAQSPRFPRVTLCDFQIRLLSNILDYTVQCVLPINLFNEKIFVLIWIWILVVGALTFVNFFHWLKFMVMRSSRQRFVRKYIDDKVDNIQEKARLRKFADHYLRSDGCFLLKIALKNTCAVTFSEVLTDLWNCYKESVTATRDLYP